MLVGRRARARPRDRGSATGARARPRSRAAVATSWPLVSHAVASSGANARHASTAPRSNDDTMTSVTGTRPRRAGGRRPRARPSRSGVSASGSQGRHLISTLTIIPAHASSASASVGIVGTRARAAPRTAARRSARSRRRAGSWCTTSTSSAVRRTSSSTPSAPSSRRLRERRERVLGRGRATRPGGRGRADELAMTASLRSARTGTRSTNGRESPAQTPCRRNVSTVSLHSLSRVACVWGTFVIGRTSCAAARTAAAARPSKGEDNVALTWIRTHDWDAEDWRDQASCRDTSPELFFPIGTTGLALDQIDAAKQVCDECPVAHRVPRVRARDQPGGGRLGRHDRGRAPPAPQGPRRRRRRRAAATRSPRRRSSTLTARRGASRPGRARAPTCRCRRASRSSPGARSSRAPARSTGRARATPSSVNCSGRPAPLSRTSIST